MRSTHVLAVTVCSILGCGSQPAPVAPAPQPEPVAAPTPPPPEPEPEPEAEPVVAAEPKTIEIQRDVIRLKPGIKILFQTNSAQLLAESNVILDEVASVMEQNAKLRIRVEGHTDNVGKPEYNKDLSTKRAASVRTYLVGKGLAEDRLESTGCGQEVPVAENKTEDGKQQNRRVEFVILRKRRVAEPCQVYKPRERRRDRTESGSGSGSGSGSATPTP